MAPETALEGVIRVNHPHLTRPTNSDTRRYDVFVRAYCANGFNATKAALSAGYSEQSAYAQGADLISRLVIRDKIEKRLMIRAKREEAKVERVILELCRTAFANILDYIEFSDDGTMKLKLGIIPREHAYAIERVNYDPVSRVVKSFQLCDKMRALELLCKYLGMSPATGHRANQQNLQVNVNFGKKTDDNQSVTTPDIIDNIVTDDPPSTK